VTEWWSVPLACSRVIESSISLPLLTHAATIVLHCSSSEWSSSDDTSADTSSDDELPIEM